MAPRKKAAKPIVVDAVAYALAEIDKEIARLKGLAKTKQAYIDRHAANAEGRDEERFGRVFREASELEKQINDLSNKRWQIELTGQVEEPRAGATQQPRSTASWKIKHVERPELPDTEDEGILNKALDTYCEHAVAAFKRVFRDAGVAPDSYLSAQTIAALVGSVHGLLRWQKDNMELLEQRVAMLESGGIKYAGTWQRAQPEHRKGTVVTHDGAMWIALRDTKEGEQPGKSPEAWQLSAKQKSRAE